MPKLQNFSVTRNNDEAITVTVDSDVVGDSLAGATVEWSVYGMSFAVPTESPQLIVKSSLTAGEIDILGSPDMTFVINLKAGDTFSLDLGNYYHEGLVIDNLGNRSTVVYGAMALTMSVE